MSYPVQRAAEAVYSDEGKAQTRELVDYYMHNAGHIAEAVSELGFHYVGGENAPYIWIGSDRDSWEFFDQLLNEAGVVCTPEQVSASAARGISVFPPSIPMKMLKRPWSGSGALS